MDVSRNDMLSELANDAGLERTDFVVQATEQLAKFLDRNRDRISQIGGLTLVDEDPDYLSVAPDCTFRVRSRYEDAETGEWVSDTEIVETPSELIELYNPLEIFAAFTEAAREAAGMAPEPTATGELMGAAGISPEETVGIEADAGYVGAAEQWAAGRGPVLDADDEESAALALYNLALDFQDRSQQNEASLHRPVRGGCRARHRAARRPDHRGRRGRAAGPGRQRPVPGRGPAGGRRRRVAPAQGPRGDRRVLRSHGRLRGPRRRAGRGLPGDRPRARGRRRGPSRGRRGRPRTSRTSRTAPRTRTGASRHLPTPARPSHPCVPSARS